MATVTRDRHVRVGGLPLMTPAWHVTSLASVDEGPSSRGGDVRVPYSMGESARRRWMGPRRIELPIVVFGDADPDGVAYADPVAGLTANMDLLKAALRPRQSTNGTSFRYYPGDGSFREASGCSVQWPLQIGARRSTHLTAVIDVVVPGGVLRDPTATVEVLPVGTTSVTNPGTADQFEVVLEAAGAFTIANESWSATQLFEYTGTAPVTIDTRLFTARYADDSSAINEVAHEGHETWLPLLSGINLLTVTGSAVTLTHYPPYL